MKKRKLFICILTISLSIHQSFMGVGKITFAATNFDTLHNKGIYETATVYESYMKEYPNCIQDIGKWKKVDGKYQYPITAYDEEWQSFPTVQEKYVACHIPVEIIKELSTKELLELVLDCPLIINIYAYFSYDEGVKEVAKQFNGLAELLQRTDCLSVVLSYYDDYKIPKQQKLNYDALLPENPSDEDYFVITHSESNMKKADEDIKVNEIIDLCESIIEIAAEQNTLNSVDTKAITQTILKKDTEKKQTAYLEENSLEETKSDSLYNTLRKNTGLSNVSSSYHLKGAAKSAGDEEGVLYTPSGEPVWYVKHTTWSNISDSKVSAFLNIYNGFKFTNNNTDAVTCMQNGTTKYDCFNYAWLYHYSKYKNLWKQCDFYNDKGFRNDSWYVNTSLPADTLVVGSNGSHAVIVTTKKRKYKDSNGNVHEEPLVKSKWATNGPLMKHPLSRCPFNTSGTSYYC